jgi:uncharacterized damage-inducible protein DinB
MTYEEVNTLVDFHYWARDRALGALESLGPGQFTRQLGGSFPSIRDTIVHIYAADLVWYSRWACNSPSSLIPSDKFSDVAALRSAWNDLEQDVRKMVCELGSDGIHREFEYTLFNGQRTASPFWQTLQHVVNHGSYHRGQITTLLRQIGAPPPGSMDLMAFYRTRKKSTQQTSEKARSD